MLDQGPLLRPDQAAHLLSVADLTCKAYERDVRACLDFLRSQNISALAEVRTADLGSVDVASFDLIAGFHGCAKAPGMRSSRVCRLSHHHLTVPMCW